MKFAFSPKTTLGKWSVGLSIVVIILIWAKIQYSIPVPAFAIAVFEVTGFIMSLVAIFKNKDRSLLNLLPLLVGLLIILWIACELIFPH